MAVTKKKQTKPKKKVVKIKNDDGSKKAEKQNITMEISPKIIHSEMDMDTSLMMQQQTNSDKIDFDAILGDCLKKQDLFTS
jgi:DNA-directed RNA polymerase